MNQNEKDAFDALIKLQSEGKRIEMQLWPPTDSSIIEKTGNRMLIQEGRWGKFEDISEDFYDRVVQVFDWRSKYDNEK